MPPLRALIVEDSESDCELLLRTLTRGGYDVSHSRVDSASSLRQSLDSSAWDIVISDYSIPGFSGVAALKIIRDLQLDMPFIFLSGTIGEDTAVEAMKMGANDYVMKGNLGRLLPAIRRELAEVKLRHEHAQAEARMRQLEKFEAIGQLAGGIAHDFNNVIGAIQGWAQLGLEEVEESTRPAKYLRSIKEQSQRAGDLTRQLLTYARRQVLEPRNVDLNQLILGTTELLRRVIGADVEMKLALASAPQIVLADPTQIEQILMNLCINARDAMPEGGRLVIETCTTNLDADACRKHEQIQPGKYVRLSVSDTGIGMDDATRVRIFEPFFTTKEEGRGTGLGLATVMGVVKQHDGAVDVESKLGVGTSFHIYLRASSGAPESRATTVASSVRGGSETLLVAEDNDGLREMLSEVLHLLGYSVILAKDGAEAVEKFTEHSSQISLVMTDSVMPKLTGLNAYARIASIKPDVPVIFMSGYAETVKIPDSSKTRRLRILQKPFDRASLANAIRDLLDQPQPQS